MQISKITQPMFAQKSIMLGTKAVTQPENANNVEIKTPENYGRAMINFKRSATPRVLSKQDKALMETLTDTLSLTKNKAIKLKQEFRTFLSEKNCKSLNDVSFDANNKGFLDECEFIGSLTERISKKINLNEKEEDALNIELVKRLAEKENYVPGGKVYLEEMNSLEKFLEQNANEIFNR